jgi:hypothetical protein
MERERLEAIWERTVEKLKEVVREFKITETELHEAGDYFNRLGQSGMCRSKANLPTANSRDGSAGMPASRRWHISCGSVGAANS